MAESETAWTREYWAAGGGDALLFYAIYGEIDVSAPLRRSTYRTAGLPDGLEVVRFSRAEHAQNLESSFEEGQPWEQLLQNDPVLAGQVKQSTACLILRGTVRDPPSLGYLRDAIGLISFLLDHGGVAVYDAQVMKWWTPSAWRENIFNPDSPAPHRHTVILQSEDDEQRSRMWFHTRGMRKFGRPDISVRDVGPRQFEAVVELCERFIAYQALGAVIPEGQIVHISGLERVGVVHHGGDGEDPDFNNAHIEVVWQADA